MLEIDLGRLRAPVRFEEAGTTFPHVSGPIDAAAIVGVRRAVRDGDGGFVGVEQGRPFA